MRTSIKVIGLAFSCLVSFPAHATVVEIPYTGGKMAGTFVVNLASSDKMNPDTVRIGAASIRFYLASVTLPAVCGAKPTIVAQFVAPASAVWHTLDTSSDWNALTTLPGSTARETIQPIEGWENYGAQASNLAPGFALFSQGQRNTCTGEEYFMSPHWNRVVFMHFGSGVDYRAKFSFQVKRDTSYAPTPMLQFQSLKSLTLHYVVNTASNDLNGAPVSLQPRFAFRSASSSLDWKSTTLYNPLGVRLKREARPQEVVIPFRR